ncbi:amidohydrolase family protein [Ferrovibrio terrae]|uniref:amidohydrolase family protein n=1 Tax=Ferrovibrio terrae TaxID=2594003 RepID=UPI003137F72A
MSLSPTIAPPHPDPRPPAFRLPPGSCDTHCHIFGPNSLYPYVPERPYTPPDAPLAMFRALHARLGVERAVIVNATPHGRDNRVVTDAIAQSNGRYKGIANVDESFSDADLAALNAAGIKGCRFTFLPRLGALPDMDVFGRIMRRIAPLEWHVDLYLPAVGLEPFLPMLESLPVPYVIDHMGVPDAAAGIDQTGFQILLRLFERDRKCWVKLTCPERITAAGAPFHDAAPFARRLIEIDADRVLWGTDWPHPNVKLMPDDGDLVDLIPLFAPTAELQRKLLVDNPTRLFGFKV